MNSKPWWASKTVWANVLMIASLTAATLGFPPCGPELPEGAQCIPLGTEEQAAIVGGIMGAVNLVLRVWTRKRITLKKES